MISFQNCDTVVMSTFQSCPRKWAKNGGGMGVGEWRESEHSENDRRLLATNNNEHARTATTKHHHQNISHGGNRNDKAVNSTTREDKGRFY